MKRFLSIMQAVLLLLTVLPVLPAAAAEAKDYRFDFEGNAAGGALTGSELAVSGFYHQVVGGVDTHGNVLYLASRAGEGDTTVTLPCGYAEKLVEFEFLYSGDFGAGGGLRCGIYQSGSKRVSALISPVVPLRVEDTASGGSVLGTSGKTVTQTDTWMRAKLLFASSVVCVKVWKSGEREPEEWDSAGVSSLSVSDAGSTVMLRLEGCGAGTGNLYLDDLVVSPMTDALRAQLPRVEKPLSVTLTSSDTKMGTVSGGGAYPEGTAVTVRAVPRNSFVFVNWTDRDGKEVSKDMEYSFALTQPTALRANFAPLPLTLRSFMAEGLTTAAEIDNEKKTVSLRFASDVDLKNVYPYFYTEGGTEPEEVSFARMDLSSGEAKVGDWTIRAVQNEVMTSFYVDGRTGNDANDGKTAKTAFASLERAKEAVAALKERTGDVIVNIAKGEYRVEKTLEFTADDAPARGFAVIWQGMTGDPNDVILSGGVRLDGLWTETADVSVGEGLVAWEYDAASLPFSRDLYVNGAPAQIAKYVLDDNTAGNWEMADVADLKLEPSFGYTATGALAGLYDWKNPSDLEFAYEVGWTYSIVPVESVLQKGSGTKVTMKKSAFDAALKKGGVQIKDPNFILFCFEGLDEAGEWYYDRAAEKIYYLTKDGDDPNKMDIVLPTLDRLLSVRGEDGAKVYGFTLRDLRFEYTSYLRPHTYGQAEIQASYIQNTDALNWKYFHQHDSYLKTDGGITVAYAEGARVAHCVFTSMAASAFDYEIGCVGCQFVRNTVKNVGANGISVGGVSVRDAQPYSTKAYVEGVLRPVQPDPGRVTQYTLVFSNRLDGIGQLYKGSVGISVGHVADVTVAHNTITNASYSGISIGWGWGAWDGNGNSPAGGSYYDFPDTPSVQARYVVMNNDISKVCQRLADGGTVYALSLMPGSRLVGNLMHDSPIKFGGVYFDTATGGFDRIEGNILYSVYQDFFYHTTSGFYEERDREMTALMQNGTNYLGVTPAVGEKDPVYKAIEENAGIMDEALPPDVSQSGEEAKEPAAEETTVETAPVQTGNGSEGGFPPSAIAGIAAGAAALAAGIAGGVVLTKKKKKENQ